MSLFDALSQIAEQIKQHRALMNKSEATVEQVSVRPFIDALGYDTQNPAEVRKQYAILNWDAVDFAVLQNNEPIMVIEAKKSSETLGAKFWKQLFEYFNADKARIGILTNGVEYRFYTDSVKQNIMDDEPSLTINLDTLDKVAVAQLKAFTKSRFHPEHSLRKVKIRNLLARELRSPSDDFVRYFAKQIHSGAVWQTVIEAYRPIVKQCLDDIVGKNLAKRTQPKPEKHYGDSDPGRVPSDVLEIPIFAVYKGNRFEASLQVDDTMNWHKKVILIRIEGALMTHFQATKKVMRTVSPGRKSVRPGLRFWQFLHPATREQLPIQVICDDVQKGGPLRQQLLKSAQK